MFGIVLLLISKLFNFLLRYWTKFKIRFRGFVEKFWKVDEFSRNPEWVASLNGNCAQYKQVFEQDSGTILFDFIQSTYRCCMKILTEAAHGDNEFSMCRVEQNVVSKWSVYRFNISKSKILSKDISYVRNIFVIYDTIGARGSSSVY